MKLGKVKDVFMDFMKSGFYFGRGFSNMITGKLEASATTARVQAPQSAPGPRSNSNG